MYRICLCIIMFLVCASCATDAAEMPKKYYDLQRFINGQIELLNRAKPTVEKQMRAAGAAEQVLTADIDWGKELELFLQSDLNKAAFQTSYNVARPDSLTYQYSLKATEKLPVKSLRICLDSASGQPALVEALLAVENKLYRSEKKILLRCGQTKKRWVLQSYQITGFQKLVLTDQKNFEITSVVKH